MPAVQVRPGHGLPKLEVRPEGVTDAAQRVDVFAKARDDAVRVIRFVGAERVALAKPPGGGALVNPGGV